MRINLCNTEFELPKLGENKDLQTLVFWNVNQQEAGVIHNDGTVERYSTKRYSTNCHSINLTEPGTKPAIVLTLQFMRGVIRRSARRRVELITHMCVVTEDGTARMEVKGSWYAIDLSDYITEKFLKTELRKLVRRL